ncbi:MAG: O-antigen ligase family protein [Acidobacteriia bacterium]|nr:O-antigen ligase family protein [Terriglobia bacterium]
MLVSSTLTISAQGYWAVGLFQAGLFLIALTVLLTGGLAAPRAALDLPSLLLSAPLLCGLLQLAVGTSEYPHATWSATLQWGALFCLALLVKNALQMAEVLHRFLSLFLGIAVVLALHVLVQPSLGTHLGALLPFRTEDMAGPFQNRNTYASFIELAVPVAGWQGLRNRRNSWIYWMAIGIMFASVVSSASRAGSVLVVVEMVVLMLIARWRRMALDRTILLATAQMTALTAAWVMLAGAQSLWTRLQFADPLVYRRDIFASTIEMIRQRPWSGFGLGTFPYAYPRFARFDVGKLVNFAHNDWLQWGAEGGLPLLAAMVILALWCVRPACRHIWGLGVVFVFLHACVDFPMQRVGLAGWVITMVAALSAAEAAVSASHTNQPEPSHFHSPRIEEVAAVQ